MSYAFLMLAIVAEVIATTALKAADGFTRPLPTVVTLVGYVAAFYFLSLVLRSIPVGVAYAIWSGVGIVLIAAAGWLFYGQTVDPAGAVGMGLIVAGVAVLNLFSRMTPH